MQDLIAFANRNAQSQTPPQISSPDVESSADTKAAVRQPRTQTNKHAEPRAGVMECGSPVPLST